MRICRSCGGRYEPIGRDGVRYFHACPPIVRVRVQRDGAELVVDRDQVRVTDTRLEDVVIDRPNHRNENVRGWGATARSSISDGDGASDEP